MTEQEQFLACAELDGKERQMSNCQCKECLTIYQMDYSTRDAVIAVIEKQSKQTQINIVKLLETSCIDGWYDWQVIQVMLAPANRLREALLRATGKWKE